MSLLSSIQHAAKWQQPLNDQNPVIVKRQTKLYKTEIHGKNGGMFYI